jgi:hypothetical protein
MNTKTYYTASIWLGILPILVVSLVWAIGLYTQPTGESAFLLPHSFTSAINAFFFPYALSVLWIRVVELSGSGRKLAFLQKLWWVGFVLMVLFWVMTGSVGLLNDATPELESVSSLSDVFNKPQSLETDFISNYSASVLSTITVSLATAIQSIILCITIWITRKDATQKGIRVLSFWGSALTGLTGMAFLITNRFFLDNLLYPPFFISDIYIAGPSLSQAPKLNIWSLFPSGNWDRIATLLFAVLFFTTAKQLTKASIIFGVLILATFVKKVYSPENATSADDMELSDCLLVLKSFSSLWYSYFSLLAIVYQSIVWNEEKLTRWLVSTHLFVCILVVTFLWLFKPAFNYYEQASIGFSTVLNLAVPLFILASQTTLLINYWLSNYRKTKPSVM